MLMMRYVASDEDELRCVNCGWGPRLCGAPLAKGLSRCTRQRGHAGPHKVMPQKVGRAKQ